MNQEVAKSHVLHLARRHKVTVNWRSRRKWHQFEAMPNQRAIWVREPRNLMEYVSALHEIGHVACPVARRAWARDDFLVSEAAAWEWAMRHVDPDVGNLTGRELALIEHAWGTSLPHVR